MLTRYSRSMVGAKRVRSKLPTQLQPTSSFVLWKTLGKDIGKERNLDPLSRTYCTKRSSRPHFDSFFGPFFRDDFDVTIPRKRISYGLESQSQSQSDKAV